MNNNITNKFTIQDSFAISAGAGSGKTYTLSRRYINAILGFDFFKEKKSQPSFIEKKEEKQADVTQIVTITYTKAAALEMKGRIFSLMQSILDFLDGSLDKNDGDYDSIKMGFESLDDEKQLNEQTKEYIKTRLQKALANSNNTLIMTIHVFCLTLLQQNSDIAKLDTKITMIDDAQKDLLIKDVLLKTLETNQTKVLELFEYIDKFRFESLAHKYLTNSKFRVLFDDFVNKNPSYDIFQKIIAELKGIDFNEKEEQCETFKKYLQENDVEDKEKYIAFVEKYIENFSNFNAMSWSALSNKEKVQIAFNRKPWTKLKEIKPAIDSIKELDGAVSDFSAIDDKLEQKYMLILDKLHLILLTAYHNYIKELRDSSKLDFDAILSFTKDIINKIDTDFKYTMIDEFQDTNSLQIDIINTISKNKGRNLFVVGDSKQSIYAFQGAELEVFNNEVGSNAVSMSHNFRSDKQILEFVNTTFEKLFEKTNGEFLVTNYEAIFKEEDKLSHKQKDNKQGSVEFLISYDDKETVSKKLQWKYIAKFVKGIKDNTIQGYDEIKEKIAKEEKAIGILFDSKTHMLKLKKELNALGVECKVSATDKFYDTKEVKDIFFVLKATEILKRKKYYLQKEENLSLTKKERFYIAAALRSNLLRYAEEQIVEILQKELSKIIEIFENYIEASKTYRLSVFIKYLVDNTKLLDTYNYVGDINQRSANIEQLIKETISYEEENSSNLYEYLKELEQLIFFSKDLKVDEAFYKSKDLESIELCTIHSTKGLAYPMVILAQSEKDVLSKSSGEFGVNFNTFTIKQNNKITEYGAVGFKIDDYEPLIYRMLKLINKNKDEAERKRLLYVALTRAEHNIVIAGSLWTSNKAISLSENSYLKWLSEDSFGISKEELLNEKSNSYFSYIDKNILQEVKGNKITADNYPKIVYEKDTIDFAEDKNKIASHQDNVMVFDDMLNSASVGTKIHSIIQRYWDKLEDEDIFKSIFFKYKVFDDETKSKLINYIDNFKSTTTYTKLKNGAKHHFELELHSFDDDGHIQGIIDLVYFDEEKDGWIIVDFKSNNIQNTKDLVSFAKEKKYDEQLQTYEELCKEKDMVVKEKLLLFLESGAETII